MAIRSLNLRCVGLRRGRRWLAPLALGIAIGSSALGCSDDSPATSGTPPPPPSPCDVADAPPPETPRVQSLRTATQIWSGISKIRVSDGVLYGNAGGVI